jgi:hypothetical protein
MPDIGIILLFQAQGCVQKGASLLPECTFTVEDKEFFC